MTSRKRLVFSYCCLALLLAMLFAVSLFWGSVALTPQAVLAALTGRGQDALSVGIITQLRLPRAVMAVLLGAALSAALVAGIAIGEDLIDHTALVPAIITSHPADSCG